MIIKKIDLERSLVLLSIKNLTAFNADRIQTLKYGIEYKGRILGKKYDNYYVLLDNIWIEIPVESKSIYKTGDSIEVLKASSTFFLMLKMQINNVNKFASFALTVNIRFYLYVKYISK